ncbi:GNAT family N-acetyltransferase [Sphingobacterium sp. SRCM116780]|uniref:GNAT family N-acetyltransferase n=1 Tax=Sphingobacterium sp. SRCM116780 TaxID=2907623 RepID=UPI001F1B05BB|nr:GNAT family protein [Sphingobacterium sp. SRCM116780]UIR56577.1 GNAT family N-acetyltransferase [Sphingobacterium sp. SRCM116780]
MDIRKTTVEDLDQVMATIDIARGLMRASGNTIQWTNGYPSREYIQSTIEIGENYVCTVQGEIVGTFCFSLERDPNYTLIEDGQWLNDEPYGVIHRLASNGKVKGVAMKCFQWCFEQCHNIRVDTHESNIPMQKVMQKLGYKRCGIIYVHDGTARLAFQKID